VKHAKADSSRKLSEFFKQTAPRSSSPSSRPGSGSSSRGKGAESCKEAGPVLKNTKCAEVQTSLTMADLVELEGKASSSHLTASLQQVRGLHFNSLYYLRELTVQVLECVQMFLLIQLFLFTFSFSLVSLLSSQPRTLFFSLFSLLLWSVISVSI